MSLKLRGLPCISQRCRNDLLTYPLRRCRGGRCSHVVRKVFIEEDCGLRKVGTVMRFFSSDSLQVSDMSDEEKLKSPAVIIGLSILILPFIAGVIALQVYK